MALVTGSHGLSGRAVYEHLHGRPGWEVIGASRRAEPTVAGAPHIAGNLADRAATRDAPARCGPTNLFFGAYIADHDLAREQVSGLDSGQVTTWTSWHRWTAVSLLAGAFLAVAACQRAADSSAGILELIPVTVPELLRQLRGIVIPEPRRDKQHRDPWALWRRRHQYDAQQARQRWHAYADEVPR